MMNSLRIDSVSIHGLRNSIEQKTSFRFLKRKEKGEEEEKKKKKKERKKEMFDIISVQESY